MISATETEASSVQRAKFTENTAIRSDGDASILVLKICYKIKPGRFWRWSLLAGEAPAQSGAKITATGK